MNIASKFKRPKQQSQEVAVQNHWLSAAESGKSAIMGKLFSIKGIKNKGEKKTRTCFLFTFNVVNIFSIITVSYCKAHTQFQIRQIILAADDASS